MSSKSTWQMKFESIFKNIEGSPGSIRNVACLLWHATKHQGESIEPFKEEVNCDKCAEWKTE